MNTVKLGVVQPPDIPMRMRSYTSHRRRRNTLSPYRRIQLPPEAYIAVCVVIIEENEAPSCRFGLGGCYSEL